MHKRRDKHKACQWSSCARQWLALGDFTNTFIYNVCITYCTKTSWQTFNHPGWTKTSTMDLFGPKDLSDHAQIICSLYWKWTWNLHIRTLMSCKGWVTLKTLVCYSDDDGRHVRHIGQLLWVSNHAAKHSSWKQWGIGLHGVALHVVHGIRQIGHSSSELATGIWRTCCKPFFGELCFEPVDEEVKIRCIW